MKVFQGEPQPAPLDIAGLVSYVNGQGFFDSEHVLEIIDDVLTLDAIFLSLARTRAAMRIKDNNR